MAKLAMYGPFNEGDLHDDFRPDPVRSHAWQAQAPGERRFRDLERVESCAELEQQLPVEARADFAREDELILLEIADEQRAEADARTPRVGEPADHELLRSLAFHLEPLQRAALLVDRVASLGDDPLPSFAARALPRLRLVECLN